MVNTSYKGKLVTNFPKVVSEFENAMHKFAVKKILYRNVFRGKGLEFDSYRIFQQDDDASLIDWKASLRANQILARKYIEERDLNIYFLLDVSSSMLFGSSDKLKAEYAAEVVAALSHLILSSGDSVGLLMFNNDVVKVLRPSQGRNQFALLSKFMNNSEFYGGGFDLDSAIDYALKTVKSSYTVFILVSDFIGTSSKSLNKLKLLGARFESLAIMIRDEMDEDLPDTSYQIAVQDPVSGRQMVLDPVVARSRYVKNALRYKMMVKDILKKSSIDLLELHTDKKFAPDVSTFLKRRSKGTRI